MTKSERILELEAKLEDWGNRIYDLEVQMNDVLNKLGLLAAQTKSEEPNKTYIIKCSPINDEEENAIYLNEYDEDREFPKWSIYIDYAVEFTSRPAAEKICGFVYQPTNNFANPIVIEVEKKDAHDTGE